MCQDGFSAANEPLVGRREYVAHTHARTLLKPGK
jgi:hypothetical protein